jgi:hypothetical protein
MQRSHVMWLLLMCIKIADDVLGHVDSVKYLWVIIDEQLNFRKQIEFISKKISVIVGILYRLWNILAFHVKKLVYFSLIHSHISYACEIFGHASVSSNWKSICFAEESG